MIGVLVSFAAMLALGVATPYWWWIMAVPFAFGAAAARTKGLALRTGLISAFLAWGIAAAYFYGTGGRIIAGRMAAMFRLERPWLMVAVTAAVAAVAGGAAGYAGFALRALFKRKTQLR
jgi:hypothetical protein